MTAARTLKTLADLHPDDRAELIGGAIVEKAAPLGIHGHTQGKTYAWAYRHFGDGDPPDGAGPVWWLGVEVHIALEWGDVVCPDIAGWRTDRHPSLWSRARAWPMTERPDWICEVLSDSNATHDLLTKLGLYYDAHVAHYWILDPLARSLLVYRWTAEGYLLVCHAKAGDRVRAEPFDSVELDLARLLPPQEPA